MTTITIPKNLMKTNDLMILPRREYEEFAKWKDIIKSFKTFIPTAEEKRNLKKARKDYKEGKYLTLNEFKQKLGIKS